MQDGMQHVNVKTDWKHDIDGGLDATNTGIVGLTMARAAAMDAALIETGALSFVSQVFAASVFAFLATLI